MNTAPTKPSLLKIIATDLWAGLCIIFPIAIWGVYFDTSFGIISRSRSGNASASESSSFFLILASVLTILGILGLMWRINFFTQLVLKGERVKGQITEIYFRKGHGRIEFIYYYQGSEYNSGSAVRKTRTTKSFRKGQEIGLLIDPDNPRKAIIEKLYIARD